MGDFLLNSLLDGKPMRLPPAPQPLTTDFDCLTVDLEVIPAQGDKPARIFKIGALRAATAARATACQNRHHAPT